MVKALGDVNIIILNGRLLASSAFFLLLLYYVA